MTDAFEAWIKGMSDDEYEDWLEAPFSEGGASDAQEEKALNIREAPTPQELEDLELEQEFEEPEPTPRKGPRITEIERPQPRFEEPQVTKVPTVAPRPTPQPRVIPTRVRIPRTTQIRQAVTTAVTSAGKFIRRFFRV